MPNAIAETVSIGEQGRVLAVVAIQAGLPGVPRPRVRQLSRKVDVHSSIAFAEQYVGNAAAFAARQPRDHKSSGRVQLRSDPRGAACQKDRYDGNAALSQAQKQ